MSGYDKLHETLDRIRDAHDCDDSWSVHTVGFFDEGPSYGIGVASSSCDECRLMVAGALRDSGELNVGMKRKKVRS